MPDNNGNGGAPATPRRLLGIYLHYKDTGNQDLWVELNPTDIEGLVTDQSVIARIINANPAPSHGGKPNGASDPGTSPPSLTGSPGPAVVGGPPECCYFVNNAWVCW